MKKLAAFLVALLIAVGGALYIGDALAADPLVRTPVLSKSMLGWTNTLTTDALETTVSGNRSTAILEFAKSSDAPSTIVTITAVNADHQQILTIHCKHVERGETTKCYRHDGTELTIEFVSAP